MKKETGKTGVYSDIGKRIQSRLQALGKSQPWLAAQLKISQSAVSQMLRNPQPSKHLPRIAQVLGSPYDWLASGKGPEITPEWGYKKAEGGFQEAGPAASPLQEATQFMRYFADSFSALSPQARKTAAGMIFSAIEEFVERKKK
jgi:transcriptional regulator with XRE-family HTH domain